MSETADKNHKIVNPHLSQSLLRPTQSHGVFEVYIRLAKPDNVPSCAKVTGKFAPGFLKATIPSSAMASLSEDGNVLDVELRAFHSTDTTLVQ